MIKLNGKVKSFTHKEYKKDGNSLELIGRSLLDKILYNYDENGRLIEVIKESEGRKSKRIYIYDKSGKLKMINYYDQLGILSSSGNYEYEEKGILSNTDNYEYDQAGNLVEMINIDYDFTPGRTYYKLTYHYQNGNIIERREYFMVDMYDSRFYKYNESGDEIECTGDLDPSMEGTTKVKFTYKYDDNRKMIYSDRELFYRDGSSYMTNWKYDKNENQIEEITYTIDGNVENLVLFKYDYDHNENWIRRIEFENDNIRKIEGRDIEYYS